MSKSITIRISRDLALLTALFFAVSVPGTALAGNHECSVGAASSAQCPEVDADFNGDGMVDGLDYLVIAVALDSDCDDVLPGSAYETWLDLNCDGTVNPEDIDLFVDEYSSE